MMAWDSWRVGSIWMLASTHRRSWLNLLSGRNHGAITGRSLAQGEDEQCAPGVYGNMLPSSEGKGHGWAFNPSA
jgi:hypothetical protein